MGPIPSESRYVLRDYPYIPILRMGLEPSILFDREGSGFLGILGKSNLMQMYGKFEGFPWS